MADKIREAMSRFIKNMPKEGFLKIKEGKNIKGGTNGPVSQAVKPLVRSSQPVLLATEHTILSIQYQEDIVLLYSTG